MMKNNRTRAAIAAAFLKLLGEHPIDRITVRMITDEVGCSRKTFYYYFTDVYDLTRYVCDQRVKNFLQTDSEGKSVREGFQELMDYLDSDRQVVLNMFQGYGKEELERFTWQATEGYTRKYLSRRPEAKRIAPEDLEAVIHLYSYMFYGMMVDWISSKMATDHARTMDLALDVLPQILEKLKK